MHLLLTSVATANHVRKVGESFIAVVSLAAAEEDLRVFLHGDTLLPKKQQMKHTHTETHIHTPLLLRQTNNTHVKAALIIKKWSHNIKTVKPMQHFGI